MQSLCSSNALIYAFSGSCQKLRTNQGISKPYRIYLLPPIVFCAFDSLKNIGVACSEMPMKNGKCCCTNGESDCLESTMVPFFFFWKTHLQERVLMWLWSRSTGFVPRTWSWCVFCNVIVWVSNISRSCDVCYLQRRIVVAAMSLYPLSRGELLQTKYKVKYKVRILLLPKIN